MHSQLPVGSRRVGSGPRPARRAIVGTHEAPSHVANVSTGGSDSASQQPGGGAGGSGAAPSGTTLLVSIHGKLDYGLQMGISGDATEFGNWKPEKAYILKWTEGDVWTARVDIPATVKEVKYKLLTTYKGMEFDWEDFGNRTLDLTPGGGDAICRISGEYGQALDVQISPRPQTGPPTTPAATAGQPLNVNNITSQPASVNQSSSSGGGAAPPGAHFEPAPGARKEPTPDTTGKRTTPGGISLDPPDLSKGSWRSSSSGGTAVGGSSGSSAAKGSSGLGAFSQSFSERVERAREAARGEKTAAKASKTDDLPPLADRYAEWDADLPSTAQSELSRAAEQASQGFAAAFGFETKTAEPVPVNAYDNSAGLTQAMAAYESYEDIRRRQSSRSPSYDESDGNSYSDFNDRVSKTLERLTGLANRKSNSAAGRDETDNGYGAAYAVDSWQSAPPSSKNTNGWSSNSESSSSNSGSSSSATDGINGWSSSSYEPSVPPPSKAATAADDYQPAYTVPNGQQRESASSGSSGSSYGSGSSSYGSRNSYNGGSQGESQSGRSSSDWYTEPATDGYNGYGSQSAQNGYQSAQNGYGGQSAQSAAAAPRVDSYASRAYEYESSRLSNSVHLLPDGACRDLAVADDAAPTWLEKLEIVSGMIGTGNEVTVDKIAACCIYVRWLGNCDVDCGEDDGRRGPAAACGVARDIFVNLETTAGELYKRGTRVGEVERALMRQIQPWLPSFADEFERGGAPMARIRGITSMPEVPQPLREEISKSIENKLARNAGPVALFATEAMLKTIKEDAYPGQYPQRFVDEFVAFTQELKRYFNCAGALDRLYAMEALDDDQKLMVDELRDAMSQLTRSASATTTAGSGLTTPEGAAVLRALRATTAVRGYFTSLLSTALRESTSGEAAMTQRQQWRMAEVSLEELGFVLLTRTLFCAGFVGDDDEGKGEFEQSLSYDPSVWTAACNCVSQGLRHVALSMWRPMECHAVARELEAWCAKGGANGQGPIGTPEAALRMRATLERALRLLQAHTEAVTKAYGESPALLGTALNVPSYVSDAFADTAIRGGLPFQLSRLVDPMRRAASVAAGLGEGSKKSIVLGKGVGRLVECDRLEPGACGTEADGSVIAFVWNVDGSEEVTCAGRHVTGIIAARALNPTSHLAVRARQEGVPLTATPSAKGAENAARAARELMGDWVQLTVNDGGVLLGRASAQERDEARYRGGVNGPKAPPSATLNPRLISDGVECVRLAEAVAERAGRKAATCGDLTRIAARPGSGFTALDGVVVPFGAMESRLRECGRWSAYQNAIAAVDAATRAGSPPDIERACDGVRDVITDAGCSLELAATICAGFFESRLGTGLLAVRASANVDDPAQMSGCGGHVSVVGVQADSCAAVAEAIAQG